MIRIDSQKTVIGFSKATGIILYVGFGLVGVLLGYFLPKIAFWVVKLPWVPFEGPMKLINSFNGPWLEIILVTLGLIAGIVLAYISVKETFIVTITDDKIQLKKDGQMQVIERTEIDTIFLDGKQLVVLGKSGHELEREVIDETPKNVVDGFKNYSFPFSVEGDPYKGMYRRWVQDTPDISPSANAVMKARELTLQKKDKKETKELRYELSKLGIVVRDEGTRQYWRQIPEGQV